MIRHSSTVPSTTFLLNGTSTSTDIHTDKESFTIPSAITDTDTLESTVNRLLAYLDVHPNGTDKNQKITDSDSNLTTMTLQDIHHIMDTWIQMSSRHMTSHSHSPTIPTKHQVASHINAILTFLERRYDEHNHSSLLPTTVTYNITCHANSICGNAAVAMDHLERMMNRYSLFYEDVTMHEKENQGRCPPQPTTRTFNCVLMNAISNAVIGHIETTGM